MRRIVVNLILLATSLSCVLCVCQHENTNKLVCSGSSQTEIATLRPGQTVKRLEIKDTTLTNLDFLTQWSTNYASFQPSSITLLNLRFESSPRWENLRVYSEVIEELRIGQVNLLTNVEFLILPQVRQKWERLKVLNITHTELVHVPQMSLHVAEMDKLQELILDHNQLTQLDLSGRQNDEDLKRISVVNNSLSSIIGLHYQHQKGLLYLNVSNNQLTDANFIQNGTDVLKTIDISYNRLTQFHLNIDKSQLQELHLSHNHLTNISIKNSDDLEILHLAYNRFPIQNSITATLNKLKSLRVLDISGMNGVQVELTSLPIEELFISHFKNGDEGQISLQNLNSLRKLKITQGSLSAESWAQNTVVNSLQILDVSNTYITTDFITSLERFPALKYLNLYHTSLDDISLCPTKGSLPVPLPPRGKICISRNTLKKAEDCGCDTRCGHFIKFLKDAQKENIQLSSSSEECWDGDAATLKPGTYININSRPTCTRSDLCVETTPILVTLPPTTERAIFTQWKPIEIFVVCLGIALTMIMAIIILAYVKYQDKRRLRNEDLIKNLQHDTTDAPQTPRSYRVNERPRKQLSKSSNGQMSIDSSCSSILTINKPANTGSKNKIYSRSPRVIGNAYGVSQSTHHFNNGFDEVDIMPTYGIDYAEIPAHLSDQNTLTSRPRHPLPKNSTPRSSPSLGRRSRSFSDLHQLGNSQASHPRLNQTLQHNIPQHKSNQLIDHPINPVVVPTRTRKDTDSSMSSAGKSPYHASPISTRNKFQGNVVDPIIY